MDFIKLDKLANAPGAVMPENLNIAEQVYFLGMRALYYVANHRLIDIDVAKKEKIDFKGNVDILEAQYEIFKQGVKIYNELQKLIAPSSELKNKSRDELYSILCRIELLNSGVIEEAYEDIPDAWFKLMEVNPKMKEIEVAER